MNRVLERYEERTLGLPYPVVLLDAAEEITDPDTGEVLGVAVPDAEGLASAVAISLCSQRYRLIGAEVRFIRRVLGMTGQELAATIDLDPATLSRWEHGKQEVGAWAEKALRWSAVLQLQGRVPGMRQRFEEVGRLQPVERPEGMELRIEVRVQRRVEPVEPAPGWDAVVTPAMAA